MLQTWNRGGRGGGHEHHSKANKYDMGALEEEDESDPEWTDFDPQKDTGSFFGRTLRDESALRQDVQVQKGRLGNSGKNPDIEDQFDAMALEDGALMASADVDKIYAEKQAELEK